MAGRHHVRGDEHHRDVQGGWSRAAVFGISDGLVTNVSLILGMAGAHPGGSVVRLTGLAGLVAGAFSMAAGEYVSMRAQQELLQRELDVERQAIRTSPEAEQRELTAIYERRGVDPSVARELAGEMMRDPDVALQTHAREELGINPSQLGAPFQAAASSFVTFALGAFLPLLPWLFASGTAAIVASVVIAGTAALAVGIVIGMLTGRPLWKAGLRQLLLAAVAASVTYAIGRGVGVAAH
ncbi:MAG: VIT1/CCC1 transporter family protein [Actinomycetota bacterium]|jgi:VIT1/CCC1 family predicted Fe2+/Mn2+ transporter|nr:VIT1/CCC1 transporter family protein [Actinomycetota bacterium]